MKKNPVSDYRRVYLHPGHACGFESADGTTVIVSAEREGIMDTRWCSCDHMDNDASVCNQDAVLFNLIKNELESDMNAAMAEMERATKAFIEVSEKFDVAQRITHIIDGVALHIREFMNPRTYVDVDPVGNDIDRRASVTPISSGKRREYAVEFRLADASFRKDTAVFRTLRESKEVAIRYVTAGDLP